jgi:putative FmdB family regulatory protein
MPIYDYVCQSCGLSTEVIHGVHDAGPSACERCAGPMRKALSTPAIVFRGSGWAKKDARSASQPRDGSSDDRPTSDPKSDKKSEPKTKPDAPAATGSGGGTAD